MNDRRAWCLEHWSWLLLVAALLSSIAHAELGADVRNDYQQFLNRDSADDERLPFQIVTLEAGDKLKSSVRVLLANATFAEVSQALSDPAEWCELAPMHLNVKACTYDLRKPVATLQFYVGRKYYQQPDEAKLLSLEFSAAADPALLSVSLVAEEGPYGTSDYRFHLQAIPTNQGVFVMLDLSSRLGLASSALDAYFLTLGRGKVGFSKVVNDDGTTALVRGTQGANERNVVRYLLALEVYFQTRGLPESDRFRVRVEKWYEATEAFPAQLYEVERDDYLQAKKKEWRQQQILQSQLDRGA